MTSYSFGTLTISIPEHLALPSAAGKLSADDVRRLSNPPRGIGKACDEAAACIEKAGAGLPLPPEITPDELRRLGQRAEQIDQVLDDLRVFSQRLMQANLLMDAEAFNALRRIYGIVKSEASWDPGIHQTFQPLFEFFSTYGNRTSSGPDLAEISEAPAAGEAAAVTMS